MIECAKEKKIWNERVQFGIFKLHFILSWLRLTQIQLTAILKEHSRNPPV